MYNTKLLLSYYYIIQGGATPLHLASKHGHLDVTLLLLSKGADPNAKDGNGQTPGQIAGSKYKKALSTTTYTLTYDDKIAKAIKVFLKRWPVLMTVLMLRELIVYHLGSIDMAMMDLVESIGDEADFV